MSVETAIVAAAIVAAVILVGGTAGVLHQLVPRDPDRVTLRARYRRGRHNHPRLWTRVLAALADGWREYAAAQAIWKGVPLP